MKKKNVIWIVVDCVRNYQSGTDDRDKLDIMYELENEFASFDNMMVSAPSSIMSAANFFTSVPSYYLAGNYSQFKFDKENYWCINDILKDQGYSSNSILNAYDCRSMLTDLVDLVDDKFLTKNVRPTMMRWPNSEVTNIFHNLLDSKPKDPSFYFLWYNTRLDPNMSNEVKGVINDLKERDLFDDSIIIVTADHGYPDRERGLVSDGWDLLKAGLQHDLILTNDNINVPFLLYYPGVKPGKVDTLVSTEDIVPTLMDLLEIELPFEKKLPLFGESLLPLLNNKEISKKSLDFFDSRVIRTDARFSLQKNRITSLQKQNYHYIVRHHDLDEELYDTSIDPKEVNNIASDTKNEKIVKFFREYFLNENKKILDLQKQNTFDKLIESFNNYNDLKGEANTCYVIAFSQSYLYETVIEVVKSKFPSMEISLIIEDNAIDKTQEYYKGVEFITTGQLEKLKKQKKLSKKDLVIEVVDDPFSPEFRVSYQKYKYINGKKIIRVDWNGNISNVTSKFLNSPKMIYYKLNFKKIVNKIKLGIHEPTYFVNELSRVSKKIFKK
tara:strand:- start:10431 stop:12092 length:1662 start_codon:yes stop_codon:yes gene_type:complete